MPNRIITVTFVCYLENVGKVSQVEDIVKAYCSGEEVLADFLMQTDSSLGSQHNQDQRRGASHRIRGEIYTHPPIMLTLLLREKADCTVLYLDESSN